MEPRRFYDGGTLPTATDPGEPPDRGSDPRIVLERHSEEGVETFDLERRLAYLDRHLGELLVPGRRRLPHRPDLRARPLHLAGAQDRRPPARRAAARRPRRRSRRPHVLRLHRGARGRPGGGRPGLPRRDGRHRHRGRSGAGSSGRPSPWRRSSSAGRCRGRREALVLPGGGGRHDRRDRLPRLQRDRRPVRPLVGRRRRRAVDGRAGVVGRAGRRSRGCGRAAAGVEPAVGPAADGGRDRRA